MNGMSSNDSVSAHSFNFERSFTETWTTLVDDFRTFCDWSQAWTIPYWLFFVDHSEYDRHLIRFWQWRKDVLNQSYPWPNFRTIITMKSSLLKVKLASALKLYQPIKVSIYKPEWYQPIKLWFKWFYWLLCLIEMVIGRKPDNGVSKGLFLNYVIRFWTIFDPLPPTL